MGRTLLRPFGVAVALAAMAAPVVGQGSSVATQSACVSARGHAGVAAPCNDASSIYYNPAGLAFMPSALSAGFTAIHNLGSFTFDDGREVDRITTTPIVPHGYFSIRLGADDRLAAGFGVWAPFGLGIEWPEDFEGRFISWKTQLRGLYLQPTVAYQLTPQLSIGAGPQIVLGGLELNQNVDARLAHPNFAAFPPGVDLAASNLEGTGTGVGGHVGLYYRASERLALGARYMHSVNVDLTGDAVFEQRSIPGVPDELVAQFFLPGQPFADQSVAADLTFPAQAVVGLSYAVTPQFALALDYQWTGWSSFDEIRADFEFQPDPVVLTLNYEDAHTFRLGGTFMASPQLALRAGFLYNTAATPDETVTPILPEAERQLYTAGFGYDLGTIRLDAVYNFVNQADRRGRVFAVGPAGETGTALNVGEYQSTAHLFGLTLSYGLGGVR
jgi:long-chain fatty acid transport protein